MVRLYIYIILKRRCYRIVSGIMVESELYAFFDGEDCYLWYDIIIFCKIKIFKGKIEKLKS